MAKRLIDSEELIAKFPVVEEDRQISLIGAVTDVMVMISECQTVDAADYLENIIKTKWCRF